MLLLIDISLQQRALSLVRLVWAIVKEEAIVLVITDAFAASPLQPNARVA